MSTFNKETTTLFCVYVLKVSLNLELRKQQYRKKMGFFFKFKRIYMSTHLDLYSHIYQLFKQGQRAKYCPDETKSSLNCCLEGYWKIGFQLSSLSFCNTESKMSHSNSEKWKFCTQRWLKKSPCLVQEPVVHACSHLKMLILLFIQQARLPAMWNPTWAQLPASACIFAQFSHKDSVKRVSAFQTWVSLYPAFQFSIDLGRVTLKHQEKHRCTKKSSISFFHQKASLGPGQFHSQARLVLLGDGLNLSGKEEAQNIRLPLAVNFLALSLPAIHLVICLSLLSV